MLEISKKDGKICILGSTKKAIVFDLGTKEVSLDGYLVNHPWEYEKSSILLEVKESSGNLFYHFLVDGKHLVIIVWDDFELTEDLVSFFGDIDILFIIGTKIAAKLFENIEAKLVIPYGESKDIFLSTLGQHISPVESYKINKEFALDVTEFVNLE